MKIKHLLLTLLTFWSLAMIAAPAPASPAEGYGFTLSLETTVYPNPSTGIFYLNLRSDELRTYRVRVVNLIGQTIASEEVSSNTRTRFDLSAKPKGVYFVQIDTESEQIIRRVIIQ
ncbi:MAG: T9SS C-terminal target domain-containing protein [Bacteroidetes bacterium]|nr:MAG: T9SS C-terminal target domain-containing protein [Bacteroidota bacterium]